MINSPHSISEIKPGIRSLPSHTPQTTPPEELLKIIHTAFVSSQGDISECVSFDNLEGLMATPAFQALMNAAVELALTERISELEAAKKIIHTVRSLDQIWQKLLVKEGLKTLGSSL